jgi:hypothetical protein
MILSHQRKSAFIHVPKTGGKSISRLLERDWLDAEGLKIRIPTEAEGDIRDLAARYPGIIWNRVHVSAAEMRDRTPNWDSYETFAFVRNPWDRMVSLYAHVASNGVSFEDFVLSPPWNFVMYIKPQVDYVTDGKGNLLVGVVGRFERLVEDLALIHPSEHALPHVNKATRRADYRDYYTWETKAHVAEIFRADIETFGYEF